jgi:transposase-like protein
MRYSLAFKESLIKKVLPPESRSVRAVANEAGISEQSLHNWLNKSKEGTLSKGDSVGGMTRPPGKSSDFSWNPEESRKRSWDSGSVKMAFIPNISPSMNRSCVIWLKIEVTRKSWRIKNSATK